MATIYVDDDADLSIVQKRNVAVLGYGRDGEAHALSLRDSGVDVRVGLPTASKNRAAAQAEGLRVVEPYEACEEADLVVVLAPTAAQRTLFERAIAPNLVGGETLLFSRGFSIRYGLVEPPDDIDVVMVAPQAPGDVVRREFGAGRGTPALVAVEQDATGGAWDIALSYAKAIGGTRVGALRTTFAEESEADLFGQQAVLSGGVPALVRAAVDVLVSTGYQPEIAYLACVSELGRVVDRLKAGSPDGGGDEERRWVLAPPRHSEAASGTRVVDPHVRATLQGLLDEVRSGRLL